MHHTALGSRCTEFDFQSNRNEDYKIVLIVECVGYVSCFAFKKTLDMRQLRLFGCTPKNAVPAVVLDRCLYAWMYML